MTSLDAAAHQTNAGGASSAAQRPLVFDEAGRRNGRELLHSLIKLLSPRDWGNDHESIVVESFEHAMAGLGAERGVLLHVRQELPLDLEVVCSIGFSHEEEVACQALEPSSVISSNLIRRTIQMLQPAVLEDLEAKDPDEPKTGFCAPVTDPLSGAVVAVLYVQASAGASLDAEKWDWLTAYAGALAQMLPLHLSRQPRPRDVDTGMHQDGNTDGPRIVGCSEATRQLTETLNALLPSTIRGDAPAILVTGESGTGKELVARYLYHYSPKRPRGPFLAFNCAGLRGDLVESKLFGHVKGAFTGAISDAPGLFRAANNGVLLLDEVGELPPEGQAILLRVLETRTVQPVGDTKSFPVDVQLILATNRRVEEEVAAKRFREDLYYRASGLQVELLPLRDPRRMADIQPLLAHYLVKHQRALKKNGIGLTREALRALSQFAWPGNVRQLSNVCSSLVTHAPTASRIDVDDIRRLRPDVLSGPRNPNPEAYLDDPDATYGETLRAFRKKLIFDRLRRHGENAVAAAASLGISGPTFYRYWIDARRFP